MTDEFAKTVEEMREGEDRDREARISQERLSSEQRLLIEEQKRKDAPGRVFAAHVFFKDEIEPILRTVETTYLQGKKDLITSSSVFTGNLDEWNAQWKGEGEGSWPHFSFHWNDNNGELHDMMFRSFGTFLDVTAAGKRSFLPDIDFKKPEWKKELEEGIIGLLKDPEKTHFVHLSQLSDDI